MKTLTRNLLIIFHFLLFTFYFYGCRDDSVTPTITNPPQVQDSLLFERDSLSLWRWGNVGQMYEQFTYSPDTSIKKIKITFIGETNFDSSKGSQQILIENPFWGLFYIETGQTAVNQNHIINWQVVTYFEFIRFTISIEATPENFLRYIKLKNIKIYSVN